MRASITRLFAVAVALGLVVSACGGGSGGTAAPSGTAAAPATAAARNPALDAIIEKAKTAEGSQLTLTWQQSFTQPTQKDLAALFEKMYGFAPKLTLTPQPAMQVTTANLIQQYQAGRAAETDVLLCVEVHVLRMTAAGAAEVVDWSYSDTIKANPQIIEADGAAVQILTTQRGIVYNANKVKGADVPKSLADVLRLSTKYAVATTDQASLFEAIATPEIWGEDKTIDYITQLSKSMKGIMQGHDLERVSAGEFDIFAIDYGRNESQRLAQEGQPLGWSFPTDAALVTPNYNVIPKNAAHPNMARLWVNMVVSRAGQEIYWKNELVDNKNLPGSKSAADIAAISQQGFKVYAIDINFARKNSDSFSRVRAKMQQIIANRK